MFEKYAEAAYGKDIKVKLEANVNDIIYTFGILALSKYRDSLARIAIAKDLSRMKTDMPEGAIMSIFKCVGSDFKNFDVDLQEPERERERERELFSLICTRIWTLMT